MKVVINNCFGGFGLSPKAIQRYAELAGFKVFGYVTDPDCRDFSKTIRWHGTDKEKYICVYWLKEDIGNNPTEDVLNQSEWFQVDELKRDDKFLIQVVEELEEEADGDCAKLKIIEIPDDVSYHIEEYDGNEHVAEDHRKWH